MAHPTKNATRRKARPPAATRRFAGESYAHKSSHTLKGEARKAADTTRRAGYPSRVVGRRGSWHVYVLELSATEVASRKTCNQIAATRRRNRQTARASRAYSRRR